MDAHRWIQQALVLRPGEVSHEDAHLLLLIKFQAMALLPIVGFVVVLVIIQVEESTLHAIVRVLACRVVEQGWVTEEH